MKEDKDIWSDIKNRFVDFEETPPENGWENINSRIRKVRKGYYKELGIVTALMLLIFVLSYELNIYQNLDGRNPNEVKTIKIGPPSSDSKIDSNSSANYEIGEPIASKDFGKNISGKEDSPLIHQNSNVGIDFNSKKLEKVPLATKDENNINFYANKESVVKKDFEPLLKKEKKANEKISLNDLSHVKQSKSHEKGEHQNNSKITNLPDTETHKTKPSPVEKKGLFNITTTKGEEDFLKFKKGQSILPQHLQKEIFLVADEIKSDSLIRDQVINEKKYHFQIFFSPRYTYRRVGVNTKDDLYVEDIASNKNFKQRLGYETGLSVSKDVTSKISLNVGLSFVSLNEEITYSYTDGTIDSVKLSSGNNLNYQLTPKYKYDSAKTSSNYYYTGITIGSFYSFLKTDRRRLYLIIGTGINLLIKGKTSIVLNGTKHTDIYFPSKENPLEQMNFKVNLGVGYGHKISNDLEINVEPVINYYLGSTFNEREPFGIKPYTLGINIGLRL